MTDTVQHRKQVFTISYINNKTLSKTTEYEKVCKSFYLKTYICIYFSVQLKNISENSLFALVHIVSKGSKCRHVAVPPGTERHREAPCNGKDKQSNLVTHYTWPVPSATVRYGSFSNVHNPYKRLNCD
jgi:hypothetical protein